MRVTDIPESDDTLQAAASTTECATPTVLPEAENEDDDDDDLYDDLGGQRHKDCLIDNDSGDLCSQITYEDRLDVATQNRWMLEMLLENQAQWKPEQKLERERKVAKRAEMAAERVHWAAERAGRAERSIAGPRPNIYMMIELERYCGGAKELDGFLVSFRSNLISHAHLFLPGGPDHVKYAISLLYA